MVCMKNYFKEGVVLHGRYQALAPLNHGSFGMVFTALDLYTGNTVAIKCLTKKAAVDESVDNAAPDDFAIDDKSEEQVLHGRLGRHPNIVNLVDSFETPSHVYLVLEYCARGDLYEAIRNGEGPRETEHVRRFMLELVDAIEYIHSKGIYHRDIKPENIFLSSTGAMKLGDFGLATSDEYTYETLVGSDRYMSPEQYNSHGEGYSPAQADIWAIGICMLNILFSRNPFTKPTDEDTLFRDFCENKQNLFDIFPTMSQDTFEVILQCMNLDPSKRSLVGVRHALLRAISFTTLNEGLDDFCSNDRRIVASANREPLRTPSIQSAQERSSFPLDEGSSDSPQAIRQLSAIPDNDSYSEELFSKSEATTTDWCSAIAGVTPSTSVVESSFGTSSKQSLLMPEPKRFHPVTKVSPTAGSLPITMARPIDTPSMSMVFGRKDTVSKSWSDMWEEEEEEREKQLEKLQKLNARTWSQDSVHSGKQASDKASSVSVDNDDTPRLGLSPSVKSHEFSLPVPPMEHPLSEASVHDDSGDEDLFFSDPLEEKQEPVLPRRQVQQQHHESPKQSQLTYRLHHTLTLKSPAAVDKWEALGEKRRAFNSSPPRPERQVPAKPYMTPVRKSNEFQVSPFVTTSPWSTSSERFGTGHYGANYHNNSPLNNRHYALSNGFSKLAKVSATKERPKACPWNWNWRHA